MSQIPVDTAKAVSDAPLLLHGDIDANPNPEPNATSTTDAAAAAKAPAKIAAHDTADALDSTVPAAEPATSESPVTRGARS